LRPGEFARAQPGRAHIHHRPPDGGLGVLEPRREEVANLQLADQVRDGRELNVAGFAEPLDDDLLDGPGSVHER
jgi:hypothetical protein